MISPAAVEGITERVRAEQSEQVAIEDAAGRFESLLLRHLIQTLRETSLEGGFFGKGAGSGTLESMFESYLADALSQGAPLGLAEAFSGLTGQDPAAAAREYDETALDALGSLKWG